MNENERAGIGDQHRPSHPDASSEQGPKLEEERSEARSRLTGASEAVRSEAQELGSQAQQIAGDQAEKAKEAAASHLDVFADALRAASDQLAKNQSGPAAEIVSNAASGLEGLTRSLHGQSTGEMVETVRRFGRESPVAFLAGSVLAGLALGRFASVATTETSKASSATAVRTAPQTVANRSATEPGAI